VLYIIPANAGIWLSCVIPVKAGLALRVIPANAGLALRVIPANAGISK